MVTNLNDQFNGALTSLFSNFELVLTSISMSNKKLSIRREEKLITLSQMTKYSFFLKKTRAKEKGTNHIVSEEKKSIDYAREDE